MTKCLPQDYVPIIHYSLLHLHCQPTELLLWKPMSTFWGGISIWIFNSHPKHGTDRNISLCYYYVTCSHWTPPFPVRSLSILPLIQLIALLPYLRRAKALIILTPADSWVNSRIHAGLSLMNVTRSHQHGIWKSVPVLSASSSGLLPKRGSYDVHLSFSLPDFRIRSLVLAV